MQYFYHVDLVTRNTIKFVSSILEQYNSRYTFYKLFKSIFEFIFFNTEIPPYPNLLGAPGAVHPEVLPGEPGPRVSQSQAGAIIDRPAFAAGELAGSEVTTRGSPQ